MHRSADKYNNIRIIRYNDKIKLDQHTNTVNLVCRVH